MWSRILTLSSPKKFYRFANLSFPWLMISFFLTLTYGVIGGLWLAPADYLQGEGFRIIYVHAPCAFLSLFIYSMMALAAIATLVWRLKIAQLIMQQSISLGAGFTFLALVTGSLWGKPMWGTWWLWDARLTSELILLFLYLGIYLLQSAAREKINGPRLVAILILVGFVDIPIIHYSVYWWNTLHQGATIKLFSPSTIASSMLYPLLSMFAAFSLYYCIVLSLRIRCELIKTNPHWLASC